MTTSFQHPHTARSTAIALNNSAVELLRCSAWSEAAKTLHVAARMMEFSVTLDALDPQGELQLPVECDALLRTANNDRVQQFPTTYQSHHGAPAEEPACGYMNMYPVLIHSNSVLSSSEGVESTIEAEASMVLYNYALALDCAGGTAESVYRLLQMSSSLLSHTEPFYYHLFLVQLTERLLLTAQRLGLQHDCVEHYQARENLIQLGRDYQTLLQASSAPAA